MGLALLDRLTPWNTNRIDQFLSQDGEDHIYMAYVGIGWLLARLPGGIQGYLRKLEKAQGQKMSIFLPYSPDFGLIPSSSHRLVSY
ncbi:UnbL [Crocosphaera watsonii WH 0402]|uniref:UnbL n=2 Tax=Crocosphaera watsonii TaxID=263511 RepID=T2JZT0_CROWT|nr:UnbL [Crocosphaera watsonii WH 0402]